METLTRRQMDVLVAIRRHRHEHAVSPTFEELGRALGVRRVVIFEHVRALEKKGAIRVRKFKARSIRLVDQYAERSPLGDAIADAVAVLRKSRQHELADRLERNAAIASVSASNN